MGTASVDRALLVNIAYRLLSSVSEAEDAVQEAYVRWYVLREHEREDISSPTGWFVTVVTRICLDVLRSARARRERYVGEWLPEPVSAAAPWTTRTAAGRAGDPAEAAVLNESLDMALLVVLESMTPAERVAFILHDVFDYPFAEIAQIVGRSVQASRQLAASARRRVREERRKPVSGDEHEGVVSAFQAALQSGDLATLIRLLDPDATAVPDGGGQIAAALHPIHGAEMIARYLLELYRLQPDLSIQLTQVNARAGLVFSDSGGATLGVASAAVTDGRIERLWVTRNPDKLSTWCLPSGGPPPR